MSEKETCNTEDNRGKITTFIEGLVSFNIALKLYHWHVKGKASYAQHIALDQALSDLNEYIDSIVEISYAIVDTLNIVVPETKCPKDIVEFVKKQLTFIEEGRKLYCEIFIQSMLDDFQKTLEQLLYRLKRLS